MLLDRLFLLSNRLQHFRIDAVGVGHVTSALAKARGCVIARLPSRELRGIACLRLGNRPCVPVKILMCRANSGAYSRLVERLDPTLADAIIEIDDARGDASRARVPGEGRDVVGILADRAPVGQKMVSVPFLGAPASLPTGPLLLCAALGVPIVLFFGVRTGARRYNVHFEPFADRIVLQRLRRAEDVAGWVLQSLCGTA